MVERAYFADTGCLDPAVQLKLADKNLRFLLRYAMVALLQNQPLSAVRHIQLRINEGLVAWRQHQPPGAPDHELCALPAHFAEFCDSLVALAIEELVCGQAFHTPKLTLRVTG